MKKILLALLLLAPLIAGATEDRFGTYTRWTGSAASASAILFTTTDATGLDSCMLSSTAGAVFVEVTLDGVTWSTAPLSLQDFGATTSDPVLVTAAGRIYGFVGKYKNIRVKESGATPAAGIMNCWSSH